VASGARVPQFSEERPGAGIAPAQGQDRDAGKHHEREQHADHAPGLGRDNSRNIQERHDKERPAKQSEGQAAGLD
jgi:hypothetical protein